MGAGNFVQRDPLRDDRLDLPLVKKFQESAQILSTSGPPSRLMTTRLYLAVGSPTRLLVPAPISAAVFGCDMSYLLSDQPLELTPIVRFDLAARDA